MSAGTERLPWLVEPLPASPVRRGRFRRSMALAILSLLIVLAVGAAELPLWSSSGSDEAEPTLTRPLPAPIQPTQRKADPAIPASQSNLVPAEAMPVAAPSRIEPVRAAPRIRAQARTRESSSADDGNIAADEQAAPTAGRAVFPADDAPAAAPPTPGPRPIVIHHPQPMRGRVVQLGAFASTASADRVWRGIVWSYPYLAAKPKVLSPIDVKDRRTGRSTRMYRLQLATASQAQSAVICQQLARAWRN